MAGKIKPIFTADLNNPDDMKLLKKYFSREAIDKAFSDGGGRHRELLENVAWARFEQEYIKNTPPEEPEPEITGTQMSLF